MVNLVPMSCAHVCAWDRWAAAQVSNRGGTEPFFEFSPPHMLPFACVTADVHFAKIFRKQDSKGHPNTVAVY